MSGNVDIGGRAVPVEITGALVVPSAVGNIASRTCAICHKPVENDGSARRASAAGALFFVGVPTHSACVTCACGSTFVSWQAHGVRADHTPCLHCHECGRTWYGTRAPAAEAEAYNEDDERQKSLERSLGIMP